MAEQNIMEIDEQALKDYLAKLQKSSKCPLCGKRNWMASNQLFKISEYASEGIYNKCLLIFPVCCENCGYSIFVNGIISGLIPNYPVLN